MTVISGAKPSMVPSLSSISATTHSSGPSRPGGSNPSDSSPPSSQPQGNPDAMQRRDQHAGRRRLPVGSDDRDQLPIPQQFRQHLAAAHLGHAAFARERPRRMLRVNRRGAHEQIARLRHPARRRERHAGLFQPAAHRRGQGVVLPAHPEARVLQTQGQGSHACAAGADKVDRADVTEKSRGGGRVFMRLPAGISPAPRPAPPPARRGKARVPRDPRESGRAGRRGPSAPGSRGICGAAHR